MAKQIGIVPLRGTIGNITFQNSQNGLIAMIKSNLSKERILTDEAFERTRENAKEFARAGHGAHTLREIFTVAVAGCYDNRLQARLVGRLMKVIHSDTASARGERNLVIGDNTLLKNFHWNRHAGLTSVMKAPFTVAVDRVTGTVTLSIPSYIPKEVLIGNPEASHFKIIMSAAEVDWNAEDALAQVAATAILPWDTAATLPVNQGLSLTAGTVLPILTSIAIKWYQEVSGNYYLLKNLEFDTANIVDVNTL
jgi:hypothetical protein